MLFKNRKKMILVTKLLVMLANPRAVSFTDKTEEIFQKALTEVEKAAEEF